MKKRISLIVLGLILLTGVTLAQVADDQYIYLPIVINAEVTETPTATTTSTATMTVMSEPTSTPMATATTAAGGVLIQEAFFNSTHLVSSSIVTCTLEDRTTTECLEITFDANPDTVEQGPYCPEYIDDTVSLTIYDGTASTGFQVITRPLLEAMEADGFDIVDDATGRVRDSSFDQNDDWRYCLGGDANPDLEVEVTYLIPLTPKLASSNQIVSTTDFDLVGLSLDGIPVAGDPPSIYDGPGRDIPGGNIPALDPCGGHPDPAGWYHWHFLAETMNKVLDEFNITEVSCTSLPQASGTQLIGFAIDGFPIYAYDDEPTDIDECRGRTASTAEFLSGTYHYVASNSLAPNAPDCLKGLSVDSFFTYQ